MMDTMSQMNHLTLKVHKGVIHPLITQTIRETIAVVDEVQLTLTAVLQAIQIMEEMAKVNNLTEIIIGTINIFSTSCGTSTVQYTWCYGSGRTPLQPHA